MLHLSSATRLAGPADTLTHGEYDPGRPPRIRFTGRITPDGRFTPRPFRFHVYGGWFCPYSHRVALVRELAGLHDLVTMSYVDNERDGRGWAFRAGHGPDPVNGFTLLREVYEATEEGFDGHIGVPVLWDRFRSGVVSNNTTDIERDLATSFLHLAPGGADLYPAALRERIDELDARLAPVLDGEPGRDELLEAYELLDARLHRANFLVGGTLTLADLRAWVHLVRYDAGVNATRTINPGLLIGPSETTPQRHRLGPDPLRSRLARGRGPAQDRLRGLRRVRNPSRFQRSRIPRRIYITDGVSGGAQRTLPGAALLSPAWASRCSAPMQTARRTRRWSRRSPGRW